MADDDLKYMQLAIEEAEKCSPEDSRPHPSVGTVIVTNQNTYFTHRGAESQPGGHAEYVALDVIGEKKILSGSILYTTLEPCTTRRHPKRPCVERIIDRQIKRIVIGMLDPNPTISGKGILRLREAGREVALFPSDLMAKVEEINNRFISVYRPLHGAKMLGRIPTDPKSRDLDDWYYVINSIYLHRNIHREPASISGHLLEVIGGLGVLASDIAQEDLIIEEFLPKAVAWWMGLCGRVGVKSISDMLWAKFPNKCPYCKLQPHQKTPCEAIKKKTPTPDWDNIERISKNDLKYKPITLSEWQKMFFSIYKPGEKEDYSFALAKLIEELGELAEAVRVISVRPKYFLNEAADVFSWLMRIANVYESRKATKIGDIGKYLLEIFYDEYADRCPRCQSQRCSCPALQSTTLARLAQETPYYSSEIVPLAEILGDLGE